MNTSICNRAILALAVGTLAFQAPAFAEGFDGLKPVSLQTLDHVRGGFSMEFNFGRMIMAMNMSHVSMINGILVPGDQTTGASGGTTTLIQQGPGNFISPTVLNGIPAGSMNTIIQNSLDSQVIRSVRTLNITITSQRLAQSMHFQSLSQSALLRFLH